MGRKVSQLIEHVIYGKGEVIERRYRGFELRVKFNNGLLRWVRREEVRFLTETPVLTKPELLKRRIMPKEQYKARQMIEAFRLGIVPHEHVEEFTFGRDVEIEGIKNRLNQAKEGSQVLIGGYGSGKTHLLEHIYAIALKNNWAVSLVELNSNELPFYKPKRIYEGIINSFRFQKEGHQYDFREFLRSIARTEDSYKLEEHLYLGEIQASCFKRSILLSFAEGVEDCLHRIGKEKEFYLRYIIDRLKREDILVCLDYAATLADEQRVKEKPKVPL